VCVCVCVCGGAPREMMLCAILSHAPPPCTKHRSYVGWRNLSLSSSKVQIGGQIIRHPSSFPLAPPSPPPTPIPHTYLEINRRRRETRNRAMLAARLSHNRTTTSSPSIPHLCLSNPACRAHPTPAVHRLAKGPANVFLGEQYLLDSDAPCAKGIFQAVARPFAHDALANSCAAAVSGEQEEEAARVEVRGQERAQTTRIRRKG